MFFNKSIFTSTGETWCTSSSPIIVNVGKLKNKRKTLFLNEVLFCIIFFWKDWSTKNEKKLLLLINFWLFWDLSVVKKKDRLVRLKFETNFWNMKKLESSAFCPTFQLEKEKKEDFWKKGFFCSSKEKVKSAKYLPRARGFGTQDQINSSKSFSKRSFDQKKNKGLGFF